jgi:hypothetical protein
MHETIKKIKLLEHQYKLLVENLENEVKPNEIDLTSFEQESTLHPKLWVDNYTLDSQVRLRLLDIADDFFDSLEIDWVEPIDIVLTGSICNYNWSKYSDIDVHIILDFNNIECDKDLLRNYFNSKKNEWSSNHDNLTIYDMDVEFYVEDVSDITVSNGVYSLEKNKWVNEPSIDNSFDLTSNEVLLRNVSSEIMTCIDDLHNSYLSTSDEYELKEISKTLSNILDLIYKIREKGLDNKGELDELNIIFKIIRRSGYLDLIWDMIDNIYDKINSIE